RNLPVQRGRHPVRCAALSALDAGRFSNRGVAAAQMPGGVAAPHFRTADAVGRGEDAVLTGWLLIAAAGLVSGALGAMGLGGGGILILCLTAFAGMEQV